MSGLGPAKVPQKSRKVPQAGNRGRWCERTPRAPKARGCGTTGTPRGEVPHPHENKGFSGVFAGPPCRGGKTRPRRLARRG